MPESRANSGRVDKFSVAYTLLSFDGNSGKGGSRLSDGDVEGERMGRGYPPPQQTRGSGRRSPAGSGGGAPAASVFGAFPAISHISKRYESCLKVGDS